MNKSKRFALLTATAVMSLAMASQAAAQGPAAETESPAENVIVVTATKSGESLKDTAAAISVLSAADVGPGGIEDAGDLAAAVPNVSVGDQFGINRTFSPDRAHSSQPDHA